MCDHVGMYKLHDSTQFMNFLMNPFFNGCPNFQLEKGVDGLFGSFARLDSRISSVGQTAAKIGDHLQVIVEKLQLYIALDANSSL